MFAKILKSLHTDDARARAPSLVRVNERARIFASLYIFTYLSFCSRWVYIFLCLCALHMKPILLVLLVLMLLLFCSLDSSFVSSNKHDTFFFLCRQLNINFTPKTIHSLQVHSLLTLKTRNILRDVRAVNGKVHLFVKLLVLCNSHYYYYPKSRDALCVAQHFFLLRMHCMKRQRVRSRPTTSQVSRVLFAFILFKRNTFSFRKRRVRVLLRLIRSFFFFLYANNYSFHSAYK